MGSLQLLYTVPLWFRHPGILGALITLIAVSVIIQQSIQYYSCSQPKSGASASVPRTNYYSPADAHIGAGLASVNLPTRGVVVAGIMNPSGNAGIPFACPSGNCTFEDPYTTLKICSSCRNAAYYSKYSCNNSTTVLEQFSNGTKVYVSHFSCTATLPNGLFVSQPPASPQMETMQIMQTASDRTDSIDDAIPVDGLGFAEFSMIAFTTSNCTSKWATGGARQPETDFIVAEAVYNSDDFHELNYESEYSIHNAMAAECTLSYCLQTYNTSIQDGAMKETVIPVTMEQLLQDGQPPRSDLLDYITVPCYLNGMPLGTAELTNGSFGGVPITFNDTNTTIPQECLYTIQLDDWEALSGYFGASDDSGPEGTTDSNFFTGTGTTAYVDSVGPSLPNTFNPQWLEPLFNDATANLSTVRDVFARLAEAMTTHVRQTGTNSTPAQGVVYMNGTCVKVAWVWITVPATLIISSCVFLVIVVSRSRALAKHKAWKSSSLALLFHGLDEDTRKDLGSLHTVSEMSRVAKNIHVELVCTDEGDRFVRNA